MLRFWVASLALASLLLAAAGCQSASSGAASPSASPPGAGSAARTATLKVKGISCPLCATNVKQQLAKVNGVTDVKIDLGSGEVLVGLVDGATPTRAQFAAAVDASGFTLQDVRLPDGVEARQ
jgi:copper chaperone CopZ